MKRGSCGTTCWTRTRFGGVSPGAIVISPGPCTPTEAGCSLSIVREFHGRIPILGVCLGHQAIAAAFHARIVRAREPMHGRTSDVFHDDRDVFSGLPNPVTVCRYHSLVVAAGRSSGLPRSDRTHSRWHHHGAAAPGCDHRGTSIPPGSHSHAKRICVSAEFPASGPVVAGHRTGTLPANWCLNSALSRTLPTHPVTF